MYSRDKLDYNVPVKYFSYMKEKSELLCSKNMHPFYLAVGILSSLGINGSWGRWGFCRLLTPFSDLIDLLLACENIRFSSLFAAGDVSRGGTSATQRQKFHTDDVKSVRNPVRSADWSTQQLDCFSYCLLMTDKKQKATKVKCNREESLTKQSIFVEYRLL